MLEINYVNDKGEVSLINFDTSPFNLRFNDWFYQVIFDLKTQSYIVNLVINEPNILSISQYTLQLTPSNINKLLESDDKIVKLLNYCLGNKENFEVITNNQFLNKMKSVAQLIGFTIIL
jgi:hypothetical protein